MLKNIKVNLEIMESMLYFWQATKDREKVGEQYIASISEKDAMTAIYDEDFNAESVRLVLSAISNREMLNSTNKKERKFWNNNMWMMEDMSVMNAMLAPLKVLNLSELAEQCQSSLFETIEICFFPGHFDTYRIQDNRLYVNFFKVFVTEEGMIRVDGMEIKEFMKEKIAEMK